MAPSRSEGTTVRPGGHNLVRTVWRCHQLSLPPVPLAQLAFLYSLFSVGGACSSVVKGRTAEGALDVAAVKLATEAVSSVRRVS